MRVDVLKTVNAREVQLTVTFSTSEGNQPFPKHPGELRYGVSISDACLGWDVTERMLRWGHEILSKAPAKK